MMLHFRNRMFQYLPVKRAIFIAFAFLASLTAAPAQAQLPLRLTPADAATTDDTDFGKAVALSGNLALVGNDLSYLSNPPPGSAYVFDVTTGQQLRKLTPTDSAVSDKFGYSVALNGNLALVGAQLANNVGAAYLFDATTGQELHKFGPSGSALAFYRSFGNSVALSGTTAIIGAPGEGAAYLFDVTTGQQLRKIDAPSQTASNRRFGQAVALSGNKAIITANYDTVNFASAYVYDITSGELLKSFATPGGYGDHDSVGLWGNIALISARDDQAGVNSGAALLFDVTTGQQLFKLTASDAAAQDYFGSSVALNGNLALVASRFDDGASDYSGSAYLFDVTTGKQLARFTSPDAGIYSSFARYVALKGHTALIGGTFSDNTGFGHGAAYLIDVTVPEPSTPLLAALATAPLAWRRRRVQSHTCPRIINGRIAALTIAVMTELLCANSVHAQQAFFQGLGYLPGFDFYSRADVISGDGSIVVGNSHSSTNQGELFRWTRGTGMVGLGKINYANRMEISDDGSTIVLELYDMGNEPSYFRWQESTGIGPLPSAFRNLAGLSSDGSKIAWSFQVWTEAGGLVPSPNNMIIADISGDGLSLVGHSGTVAPANNSGYIWSEQEGVTVLGPTLPDGAIFYNPREISADGKVVVGTASRPSPPFQNRLVMWKKEPGMIDLGPISAGDSTFSMSADGSVFTVNSTTFGGSAIWRETRGLEPLVGVLANEFKLASQMAGWNANSLTPSGISNDGRTIVGRGINPAGKYEAWIAFLGTPVPEPSTLLLAAGALIPLTWRRRGIRIHGDRN